jgi:hypothetical protein
MEFCRHDHKGTAAEMAKINNSMRGFKDYITNKITPGRIQFQMEYNFVMSKYILMLLPQHSISIPLSNDEIRSTLKELGVNDINVVEKLKHPAIDDNKYDEWELFKYDGITQTRIAELTGLIYYFERGQNRPLHLKYKFMDVLPPWSNVVPNYDIERDLRSVARQCKRLSKPNFIKLNSPDVIRGVIDEYVSFYKQRVDGSTTTPGKNTLSMVFRTSFIFDKPHDVAEDELNLQEIMYELSKRITDGFKLPCFYCNNIDDYYQHTTNTLHIPYYVFYKLLEKLGFEILERILKDTDGDCKVCINSIYVYATNNLVLNLDLSKTLFNVKIDDYVEITDSDVHRCTKNGIYIFKYDDNHSGKYDGNWFKEAHIAKIIFLRYRLFLKRYDLISKFDDKTITCPIALNFNMGLIEDSCKIICKLFDKYDIYAGAVTSSIDISPNEQKEIEETEYKKDINIINDMISKKQINPNNDKASVVFICAMPGTGKTTMAGSYKNYFSYDVDKISNRFEYPKNGLTLSNKLKEEKGNILVEINKLSISTSFKEYIKFTLNIMCYKLFSGVYFDIAVKTQAKVLEYIISNKLNMVYDTIGSSHDFDIIKKRLATDDANIKFNILVMDTVKTYNQQASRMINEGRGNSYYIYSKFFNMLKHAVDKILYDEQLRYITSIFALLDSKSETYKKIVENGKLLSADNIQYIPEGLKNIINKFPVVSKKEFPVVSKIDHFIDGISAINSPIIYILISALCILICMVIYLIFVSNNINSLPTNKFVGSILYV